MTKRELSQLYWLNIEIRQDRIRLQKLEDEIQNLAPSYQSIMAHRRFETSKAEKLAVLICEQKRLIENKTERAYLEQNRLYRFISEINDSFMREVFKLRYAEALTWREIACRLREKNESTIRKLHDRFLKKMSENSAYF